MPAIEHTAGTTSHNHAFEIIPGKGYDELSASVIRTVETAAGYYFYFREDERILERLVKFITREKKKTTRLCVYTSAAGRYHVVGNHGTHRYKAKHYQYDVAVIS